MATVYNQTVSTRFGVELNDLLANEYWTRFDVAVAWVRRSGLRHIVPSLTDFLQRGGEIRFIVGIDIENTSKEGLEGLLDLKQHGTINTFIRHNEHQSVTFHPKAYLFSNKEHARLIIGSNNLTESGLYTNTEAGLQVDAAVKDPVIVQMRAAFESWSDAKEGLALPLDSALLASLEEGGYVNSEAALNTRRASTRRKTAVTGGAPPVRLFKSRPEIAPPPPVVPGALPKGTAPAGARAARVRRPTTAPQSGVGTVVLIRPRLARKTQMQVPKALKHTAFLNAVNEMVSDHDDVARVISATYPAREEGKVNTYKMELPEGAGIERPVMRIWRGEDGRVRYRVFDPISPEGRFILQRLEDGLHTDPMQTTVVRGNATQNNLTWFRFV